MSVPRLPCLNSSFAHLTFGHLTLLVVEQWSQLSADIVYSVNTKRASTASPPLGLVCSCVVSESTLQVLQCAGTEAFSHPFLLFSWGLSCSFETGSWPLFNQECVTSRSFKRRCCGTAYACYAVRNAYNIQGKWFLYNFMTNVFILISLYIFKI